MGKTKNNLILIAVTLLFASFPLAASADVLITSVPELNSSDSRMLNLTNTTSGVVGDLSLASNAVAQFQIATSLVSPLVVAAAVVDTDLDGVVDSIDNCTLVSNADQRDTNGDGFGNICDADLNNDGTVNVTDYFIFGNVFNSADVDADADFNNDGVVDESDYNLFGQMFNGPPGPAGVIEP